MTNKIADKYWAEYFRSREMKYLSSYHLKQDDYFKIRDMFNEAGLDWARGYCYAGEDIPIYDLCFETKEDMIVGRLILANYKEYVYVEKV